MSRVEPSAPVSPTSADPTKHGRVTAPERLEKPLHAVVWTTRSGREVLILGSLAHGTTLLAAEDIDDAVLAAPVDASEAQRGLLDAVWDDRLAERVASQFAWAEHLPDADRRAFVSDLHEALATSHETGDLTSYVLLVKDWRRTAEVHADPDLLAALTRELDLEIDEPEDTAAQ